MKRVEVVIISFVFCFTLCHCEIKNFGKRTGIFQEPDVYRNVTMLISSKGYPVEDHTVQTADGYILSVQRIPYGRKDSFRSIKRKVVYLQHGLVSAASDWVLNFPEQSLGFILADEGYDVWLGNTRGSTYSRRHVKYTTKDREFWDFSFDEIAQYDCTAMIDYILKATGEEKLYFIGYSEGTTLGYALLSESPKYNEKIRLFIALAPLAYVGHVNSVVKYMAPFADELYILSKILGMNEVMPNRPDMIAISEALCQTETRFLCEEIMFAFVGPDRYQLNKTRLPVYTSHLPTGLSVKSAVHFGQLVNSKKFQKFDYGKGGNLKHYNQPTPPEYDLSRITTPVVHFWSFNDPQCHPADVHILEDKLKSLVYSRSKNFPSFNHVDFIVALQARELIYDDVLSLMDHY